MQERHILKYFATAWFAVVMGTGGLANVLFNWQVSYPQGRQLGIVLAMIADSIYIVALFLWLLRWFKHRNYVLRELNHPLSSNFFVTMPVGTAIVGTHFHLIWSQYLEESLIYSLEWVIWSFVVVAVTFFTFHITFRILRTDESPKPEMINFSWIMAPLANMALSLIGNPLLSLAIIRHETSAITILVINTAMFGIGFFLFLFIGAVVFVRLVQHPLPPADTIPSFGILLGAIGLIVIGIMDTAKNAQSLQLLASTDAANLVAVAIWGFGIWVIGIILLICGLQIRRGGIPFSLGWWAFIFPLAAYCLSSQKVLLSFPNAFLNGVTLSLTLLLSLLWIFTAAKTIVLTVSGKVFTGIPIPMPEPNLKARGSRLTK